MHQYFLKKVAFSKDQKYLYLSILLQFHFWLFIEFFRYPAQNNLHWKFGQPWNSKSVFTLSVVNQREIRRKKLKRQQQHFVTTWFFFTFPIWSFVMEYFGVMIHNQPNQTTNNILWWWCANTVIYYQLQIWNESDT
jgi:hypothetical protein